jgi:NhaA family Na+:H+ antiporter
MTAHRPSALRAFLTSESAGGLILMAVALAALGAANSPLAPVYFGALEAKVAGLSVLHWINDALMAVFFLLVGLEIKRELLAGELSTWPRRLLPGLAAVGGMAIPALVFLAVNVGHAGNLRGWAIPTATDIAFALGVLALLGPRVPVSLKIFLTALAIIDDLGAVTIIAALYTAELSVVWLGLAAAAIVLLILCNRSGVTSLIVYAAIGVALWFFVLRSGVHATLAGVALAFTIPMGNAENRRHAGPLLRLEHALQPWVGYLIVPLFGLANAGVSLGQAGLAAVLAPLPLGIALGLFVGKQIGVFAAVWIAVKLRWADRPEAASFAQIYGVALICGIGFTMSLFIGILAFPGSADMQDAVKIGVLAGSILSALAGTAVFIAAGRRAPLRTPARS